MSRNLLVLRDRINNWSLADDHKLGNVLEEIRSWLTAKITDVSNEIQENSLKIGSTCVQVSNLNNQLFLFAADQFIESCVGDDTSACADPTLTSQAAIQNKQMGATVNLRLAILMGLELMETHFKRIDIRSEDLDEDDDPICIPEPIFEPYDENLSRPLPFLIGSSNWNSSSCAGSSEEFIETAKVTEEVVVSLPPFTQPKIAECRGLAYADLSNRKLSHMVSNQATSNIKDVEAEIGSCSNEYSSKTYTSQDAAATSISQILLKGKEVENTSNFTFDSHLMSKYEISRRYSEVSIIPQNPELSLEHLDFEASHSPPDPEVHAKFQGPEISVKKILATMEDQTRRRVTKSASRVVKKLIVSSSSDEDDLFSDLRNTNVGTKQHNPTYFQIISMAEAKKSNLEKNADVPDPDLFDDVSKPKYSLKATDHMFVNDAETLYTFQNKLDDVLSNKIMIPSASNTFNSMEKCQRKENEERIKNDGTSAVLPSIAKFRSKGPLRRSPSRLLQNFNKRTDKDEAISTHASVVLSASAEDIRTIREKADVHERQDAQLEIDPGRFIAENVNSMKQKSNISSIFSSDSDDDIFSALSDKSKIETPVSKLHAGNDVLSLSFSRDHSLNTSASRTQTPKTDVKLKNLFDSDDEDIFASTISVKKQEKQPARDKQTILKKMVQKAIVPKKDGSVVGKREVAPRKLDTSKQKGMDIFGDDSDDDLFG